MPDWNRRLIVAVAVLALVLTAPPVQAQAPTTAEQPDEGQEAAQLEPLDPGKPSRVEAPDFPPAASETPATYDPAGGLAAPTLPTRVEAAEDRDQAASRSPAKPAAKPVAKARTDVQERIVKQANQLVGKRFNYAAGTKGGVLGCANVVSSILRAAGVMKNIMLSCRQVIADLLRRGWEQVKPPPYKDGDVITWATYDYTGDGRIDPDTHIGIIDKQGGTTYAINNSSSRRHPVKVELSAMNYRISRVLRKKD
jgi:hypothetical protein